MKIQNYPRPLQNLRGVDQICLKTLLKPFSASSLRVCVCALNAWYWSHFVHSSYSSFYTMHKLSRRSVSAILRTGGARYHRNAASAVAPATHAAVLSNSVCVVFLLWLYLFFWNLWESNIYAWECFEMRNSWLECSSPFAPFCGFSWFFFSFGFY